MTSYMTSLLYLLGASLSLQADAGAKIAIIGFLMFYCGLLFRSCWAELKYGRILAVGVMAPQSSEELNLPYSGPTTRHVCSEKKLP